MGLPLDPPGKAFGLDCIKEGLVFERQTNLQEICKKSLFARVRLYEWPTIRSGHIPWFGKVISLPFGDGVLASEGRISIFREGGNVGMFFGSILN